MLTLLRRLLPVLLSVAMGLMAWSVTPRIGVTFDEPAHLTAGRAYWAAQDYRLHPENGLLPQRLAALPAELQGQAFPALSHPAWRAGDVWGVGREYFFGGANDADSLVASGRAMVALLGALLTLVVYFWAHRLWGFRGALVAAALIAFCPHLLAHAGLATSDLAATLGFAVALLAWWRLLHRVTPARVMAAGAASGFLALAKFSGVLLVPTVAVMLALRLCRRSPLPVAWGQRVRWARLFREKTAVLATAAALSGLLTWGVIWAGFGFRYRAAAPGAPDNFAQPWGEVLIETPRVAKSLSADGTTRDGAAQFKAGVVQHFVRWAREHRLLPEAYLYGLAFTDRFSRGRLAYFAGEYRETGWRTFFPAAFVLKTTLPALALMVLGVAAIVRAPAKRRLLYRTAPLAVLALIYVAFAVTASLNIGHRHLLPLYPLLYVACGAAAIVPWRRAGAALVLALVAWHALESWRVRPHYLTYFNALAGGPVGASRFLVDSSLDWGQGLPDLHRWLAEHAAGRKVFLSYFGSDEPARFALKAVRFGDVYFDHAPHRDAVPELTGGLYAVSATMLRRVYTHVRGPWTESYEEAYQRLRAWARGAPTWPPGRALDETGRELTAAAWSERLVQLEQLRFGRLCLLLEAREPAAVIANSIFVYELTDADVTAALEQPLAAR